MNNQPSPTIEPQWHKLQANLIYNAEGLKPFFAWDQVIKRHNGDATFQFKAIGHTWNVYLYYNPSGGDDPDKGLNIPDDGETPDGTPFQLQTVRELRMKIWRDDDPHSNGENYEDSLYSFSLHASPRYKNCGTTYGYEEIGEAVNVSFQGSNLEPDEYPVLIASAMDRAGINSKYFQKIHPSSNITDAELYVRLHQDHSGPIYAAEGPLVRMSRVLQSDREGYRHLKQANSDTAGNRVPGWNNATILDTYNVRQIYPDHSLGKEVKHYYIKSPLNRPEDDPLAHPKLEVAYQTKHTDSTLYWSDIDQFEREGKETLYSVLKEAGLPTACGVGDPFLPDKVWTPRNETDFPVKNLPLQEIKTHQRDIVVEYLGHKGGFTPTQQEIIEFLRTDGSDHSPQDLADAIDRHEGTVYRNLKDMEELLYREHEHVSLTPYLSDLLAEAIGDAAGALGRASNAIARAKEVADRGFDEATGRLLALCEKHDINMEQTDDLTIDVGEVENTNELRKTIRELFDLWRKAGRNEQDFRLATVEFVELHREKWQSKPDEVNRVAQELTAGLLV